MNRTILFCSIFVLTISSCHEDSSVKPPDLASCVYPPGNRNFTWRSDTVAWFPSTLGGVWAFSDDDAYLTGYIGEGKPPYDIFMALHWNGSRWDTAVHGSYRDIKHFANDLTGDDHFMVSVGYWAIGQEKAALAEFDNGTKKWTGYQFQTQGQLRAVWTDGKGYFITVGDNGTVYVKDGYSAPWAYSKVPTSYNLTRIVGVSKSELYARGGISLVSGENYAQYWRYDGAQWIRLYDGQDTAGLPVKLQNAQNEMYDVAAYRCAETDSIRLILVGWESFLLETKGEGLDYRITNLADLGLPLRATQRTAFRINLFSPTDIWIFGTRYNFYHWNGNNFQRMVIPGLPNDDMTFGDQRRMVKTNSGKVFLPSEISPRVYAVVQGKP